MARDALCRAVAQQSHSATHHSATHGRLARDALHSTALDRCSIKQHQAACTAIASSSTGSGAQAVQHPLCNATPQRPMGLT